MSSRNIAVLAVLLLTAACNRQEARHEGPADPETVAQLRAIKQAIVDGHRTRDRASLDTLYPDDYAAYDPDGGRRTKVELLDGLDDGPDMVEGRYDLKDIRRLGNVAIATGRGHLVFQDGDSTSVSEYNSVNVFEFRSGRWQYTEAFVPAAQYAFENVTLAGRQGPQTVRVRQGRVVAVEPVSSARMPREAFRIDGTGKSLRVMSDSARQVEVGVTEDLVLLDGERVAGRMLQGEWNE